MTLRWSFALLAVLGSPGFAAGLCDALKAHVAQGQAMPGAEFCQLSESLSGVSTHHCAWGFAFRDDAANASFAEMNDAIAQCFDGTATPEDDGVNHPDSYSQIRHDTDQAVWRVSLKDKSALSKTYVFVSMERVAD